MWASVADSVVLKQRELESLERARGGVPPLVSRDELDALPLHADLRRMARGRLVEDRQRLVGAVRALAREKQARPQDGQAGILDTQLDVRLRCSRSPRRAGPL